MKNSPSLKKFYVEHVFRGQSNEELIITLLSFNLRSLLIGAEPSEALKILDMIDTFEDVKLDYLEFRVKTLNFNKNYQFRYRAFNDLEANYSKVALEMNGELKDFLLREILDLMGEENSATDDDDTAIVNYVMNSFEFS
jgi:hypothetical protein